MVLRRSRVSQKWLVPFHAESLSFGEYRDRYFRIVELQVSIHVTVHYVTYFFATRIHLTNCPFLLISSLFDVLENLLYEETRYFVDILKRKITQVYIPTPIECYVSNLSKGTKLKLTEFVWQIKFQKMIEMI